MPSRRRRGLLVAALGALGIGIGSGVAWRVAGRAARAGEWPAGWRAVGVPSSVDGSLQPAYFCAASTPAPLLVSLHTWSGDWRQPDVVAEAMRRAGWNCIHPDFRGPNRRPEACLSPAALADIDDAIDYALRHGRVDPQRIFVVGFSGGGHAALGHFLRSRHRLAVVFAWAPIADLSAWWQESRAAGRQYAADIRACVGGVGEGIDVAEAERRSPLRWTPPAVPAGRLELFAGIADGHRGSVPVSHALRFYNGLVDRYGQDGPGGARVSAGELATLTAGRSVAGEGGGHLGARAVLFRRAAAVAAVTIFEGGHEMLEPYMIDRLLAAGASRG